MNSNPRSSSSYMMVLAVAVSILFCANSVLAQSAAFATITGRVLDPRGGAVPNATVNATNTETGLVRTTTVTSDGLYRFENLAPGIWNVTVEVQGFTKAQINGVKLLVGEHSDVKFNLELAGQQQSIVVSSEVPLIETTKTD